MRFSEWFPYYQLIREEFGFSTEQDQVAANILSKMIKRKALGFIALQRKITGKTALVVGAGDTLNSKIKYIKKNRRFVKIVANGATRTLIENHVMPDIVVTDLDGDGAALKMAERAGAIMVVHGHSDNIEALRTFIPKFRHVLGTTQVMPVEDVFNFGGFTDGDRCVFIADEFRAREIILVGMEFGDRIGQNSKNLIANVELKRAKLKAGRRLLEMLARRSHSNLFDTSARPIRGFTYLDTDV
jgi:uncharacterized Rossmann fold enzyme